MLNLLRPWTHAVHIAQWVASTGYREARSADLGLRKSQSREEVDLRQGQLTPPCKRTKTKGGRKEGNKGQHSCYVTSQRCSLRTVETSAGDAGGAGMECVMFTIAGGFGLMTLAKVKISTKFSSLMSAAFPSSWHKTGPSKVTMIEEGLRRLHPSTGAKGS